MVRGSLVWGGEVRENSFGIHNLEDILTAFGEIIRGYDRIELYILIFLVYRIE